VFAKGSLADYCAANHIPHARFDTFAAKDGRPNNRAASKYNTRMKNTETQNPSRARV
jgi:hypothetical protein